MVLGTDSISFLMVHVLFFFPSRDTPKNVKDGFTVLVYILIYFTLSELLKTTNTLWWISGHL